MVLSAFCHYRYSHSSIRIETFDKSLQIPNSASYVDSLPCLTSMVIIVVAVSAGADTVAVGAISGHLVLIAVVVND